MGQITNATIKMIRDHIARGEHPPLTAHEIDQLATAWERGQPAASAEPVEFNWNEHLQQHNALLSEDSPSTSNQEFMDRVAVAAMQGMPNVGTVDPNLFASWAWDMAEAMCRERAQRAKQRSKT